MLDTTHRRLTIHVAPVRSATPQPARREAAPRPRPLGEALAGAAGLATVLGLVVAPVAVSAVSGLTMAMMFMGLGAPGLASVAAAVFDQRAKPHQRVRAVQGLVRIAVTAGAVSLLFAVGGLGWVSASLADVQHVAAHLPKILAGSAYGLLIAASALGAAWQLQRR
jgi:hypothetical protein